jgi:hypothetical protein
MEHKNPNILLSKTHLTNLKLNNFKNIEALELKIIASKSHRMALLPYHISGKSAKQFKIY